jgi:hypothetical protein
MGISVASMVNYKKEYWDNFMGNKSVVAESASYIEVQRLSVVKNLSKSIDSLTHAFDLAVGEAVSLLKQSDKERKKIPFRDLVQLINVLSPYVAEKKSIIGLKEPDSRAVQYNQFVQNIITKIKEKKNHEIQNNTDQGNWQNASGIN